MTMTTTTQGTPKVTILEGGGVKVDGQKLSDEQLQAVVTAALHNGVYQGDAGRHVTLRAAAERLITADEAGDTAAVVAAYGDVTHAVVGQVVGAAAAGPQPDKTPERDGLLQGLQEGEAVVQKFPLEVHNAGVRTGQLEALSLELGPCYTLADVLKSSQEKVGRGIAPRADQGVQWLRRLGIVIEPALDNEALSAMSLGFRGYLTRAAEQGQRTKKLLDRARAEAAEETTKATYEQARTEAKTAVRGELDDRLAALLK